MTPRTRGRERERGAPLSPGAAGQSPNRDLTVDVSPGFAGGSLTRTGSTRSTGGSSTLRSRNSSGPVAPGVQPPGEDNKDQKDAKDSKGSLSPDKVTPMPVAFTTWPILCFRAGFFERTQGTARHLRIRSLSSQTGRSPHVSAHVCSDSPRRPRSRSPQSASDSDRNKPPGESPAQSPTRKAGRLSF
jgi:hypothetical protein